MYQLIRNVPREGAIRSIPIRAAVVASSTVLLATIVTGTAQASGGPSASRPEPSGSLVGDPALTWSPPNVVSLVVIRLIANAQAARMHAELADLRR